MLPFILVPLGILCYCTILTICIKDAAIEEEITCIDETGHLIHYTFLRTAKKASL